LLSLALAVAFFVVSIRDGGETFRRMGVSAQQASEEVARTSDVIKQSSDEIQKSASEAVGAIRDTGNKVRGTTVEIAKKMKTVYELVDPSEPGETAAPEGAASVPAGSVVKETALHVD
jgi:methyl-accepting chemotaxis protein